MSDLCYIANIIFENLLSTFSGGAISIESVVADIHCCHFINITTRCEGGGIFTNKSGITLSNNYFYRCKSLIHIENKFGNAIYILESNACLYNNEVSFSSYSESDCCDSTVVIRSSTFSLDSLNCSYCTGFGGSSGCSFSLLKDASSAEYINIIEGEENNMMELSSEKTLTIKHANFVNGSKIRYTIIWQYKANTFTFVSCIFNCVTTLHVGESDKPFQTVDCIGTVKFSNITIIDNPKTVIIKIDLHCPLLFIDHSFSFCSCKLSYFLKSCLFIYLL